MTLRSHLGGYDVYQLCSFSLRRLRCNSPAFCFQCLISRTLWPLDVCGGQSFRRRPRWSRRGRHHCFLCCITGNRGELGNFHLGSQSNGFPLGLGDSECDRAQASFSWEIQWPDAHFWPRHYGLIIRGAAVWHQEAVGSGKDFAEARQVVNRALRCLKKGNHK